MNHLRTCILVLSLTSKAQRHGFCLGIRFCQNTCRILHGGLGTDISIHPFHGASFAHVRTLGNQVVHVIRPVLHRGVAHASMLFYNNFHDGSMQRILRIDRSRTAFYIMHVGAFVGNNKRAFELTHSRSINTEVRLQRNFYMHTLWHVYEGTTRPCCGIQRAKLIVFWRNNRTEILLYEVWVFAHCRIGIDENNALGSQIVANGVVDNF